MRSGRQSQAAAVRHSGRAGAGAAGRSTAVERLSGLEGGRFAFSLAHLLDHALGDVAQLLDGRRLVDREREGEAAQPELARDELGEGGGELAVVEALALERQRQVGRAASTLAARAGLPTVTAPEAGAIRSSLRSSWKSSAMPARLASSISSVLLPSIRRSRLRRARSLTSDLVCISRGPRLS